MEKRILRKQFIEKRKNLCSEYRKEATTKIFTTIENLECFKQAKSVFIYINFGAEVETIEFIKKYINKKDIYVPKIVEDDMKLVRLLDFSNLQKSNFGVLEPLSENYYEENIDLVITPSVVFDKQGFRLGYGKGYYDKYFAKNNYVNSLGVIFEKIIVDKVPQEPHDKAVDILVSEEKVRFINE